VALTFAGVDLSPRTPQIAALMSRWWVEEAPSLFTYTGHDLDGFHHLPIPPRPSVDPPRLNTLIWPTGANEWASFYALVGGTQAAAIEAAVGPSAPTHKPLVISDTVNGTSISTEMFMLGFRPVFTQFTDKQLWLLQLVDERYFWYTQPLNYAFTAGDSWTSLLKALVAATGTTGGVPTVPAIPAVYKTPSPIRWSNYGKPLPLLIDAAAETVGLRFVRNLDGTNVYYNAVDAGVLEAAQFSANQSALAMGGQVRVNELVGNVPANVVVSFWGDAGWQEIVSLVSLGLPEYPSIVGVPGTYAWVAADMYAAAAPADRTAYAIQAAVDYYRWLLSTTDATFRGIRNIASTGQEERIEWEYEPGRYDEINEEPVQGNTSQRMPWERVLTRIIRSNWGDGNIYGERPPPGFVYAVRLIEQLPAASGSGSGSTSGSGSGSCRPWKAKIRIVSNEQVVDGPTLGFGLEPYVLFPDCSCASPNVGDKGVAIPDPLVPYTWTFMPANCGQSISSGSSGSAGPIITYKLECVGGIIVRYRSTLSISAGALVQSAWVADSTQGCCTCPGSGSGSGTATGSNSGTGGTVLTACCPSNPIPTTVTATLTSAFCPDFNGVSWPLVYQTGGADAGKWIGSKTVAGNTMNLKFYCDGGFQLTVNCNGGGTQTVGAVMSPPPSCNPLNVQFNPLGIAPCCTAIGQIITITA
jgi:hypothetical protein